jgi:hypothetical protein
MMAGWEIEKNHPAEVVRAALAADPGLVYAGLLG